MIEGYKEYKFIKKSNNKECTYYVPQIRCECGELLGKYRLKIHRTRWTHFYYLGKLDEFELLEKNKVV
jgi:hypothetical protein